MIRKGNVYKKKVDSATRVLLIRKGNEFFSRGDIKSAEKIFVTVDYKDGILRLGDYYFHHNDLYKAAEMYFMSENESRINAFSAKCAKIIAHMMKEDEQIKEYDKYILDTGDKNNG